MARVLKRPMFRRGGSTNDGIMSGFVDRDKRSTGDFIGKAREFTPELESLLREFTPKTRLPLGAVGAAQQAQQQAVLDAQRQAAQMAVDDPRRRLGLLGTGITSITPGAGGVTLQPEQMPAAASPLSQALGFGLMGADIYGRIFRGQN